MEGVSDTELSVGLWDPLGVTINDGIKKPSRGRRFEEDLDGAYGGRGYRYV